MVSAFILHGKYTDTAYDIKCEVELNHLCRMDGALGTKLLNLPSAAKKNLLYVVRHTEFHPCNIILI